MSFWSLCPTISTRARAWPEVTLIILSAMSFMVAYIPPLSLLLCCSYSLCFSEETWGGSSMLSRALAELNSKRKGGGVGAGVLPAVAADSGAGLVAAVAGVWGGVAGDRK